ncbi:MAG: creatininase family protein [Firmicutes bacterium]|nr:creatininase family protein [Bacillota bacterium]
MYLTHMRPEQIRAAVAADTPLIMAAGVQEYHGPHLPVGTDYLIANEIVELVERACDCVAAPPFYHGPTALWAGLVTDGEVDFDPDVFKAYAKEILRGLMRMGWRRIYIIQNHQGQEGLQQLGLRTAFGEVLRETARSDYGDRWGWGDYGKLPHPDVFHWVRVCGVGEFPPPAEHSPVPLGHGGLGETQLIQAGYPETVRMDALDELPEPWPEWLLDSKQATPENGKYWLDRLVRGWVRELETRPAWAVRR